jgi:hypothetical protein
MWTALNLFRTGKVSVTNLQVPYKILNITKIILHIIILYCDEFAQGIAGQRPVDRGLPG